MAGCRCIVPKQRRDPAVGLAGTTRGIVVQAHTGPGPRACPGRSTAPVSRSGDRKAPAARRVSGHRHGCRRGRHGDSSSRWSGIADAERDAEPGEVTGFRGEVAREQRTRLDPLARQRKRQRVALGSELQVRQGLGFVRAMQHDGQAQQRRRAARGGQQAFRASRRTRTSARAGDACARARRACVAPAARSRRCRNARARTRRAPGTGCARSQGRVRAGARPSRAAGGRRVAAARIARRDRTAATPSTPRARPARRRCRNAASAPAPTHRADRRRGRGRACRTARLRAAPPCSPPCAARPSASKAASSTSTPPAMIGRRSSDRPGRLMRSMCPAASRRSRTCGSASAVTAPLVSFSDAQISPMALLVPGRSERFVPAQMPVDAGELLEFGGDFRQRRGPALLRQVAVGEEAARAGDASGLQAFALDARRSRCR